MISQSYHNKKYYICGIIITLTFLILSGYSAVEEGEVVEKEQKKKDGSGLHLAPGVLWKGKSGFSGCSFTDASSYNVKDLKLPPKTIAAIAKELLDTG